MWLPATGAAAGFAERYLAVHRAFYARTLAEADHAQWRATQLRAVLTQVAENSPFYATHLKDADLSAATPCPRDGREVVASNAHVTESWASIFRHHFGDRAPRVGLMGPTEVHSFGDTLGDVAQNTGAMNAKIWPYSPVIGFPKALQLMRDLELEVLCCTPGVALTLAKAARHYGYDLRKDFAVRLCSSPARCARRRWRTTWRASGVPTSTTSCTARRRPSSSRPPARTSGCTCRRPTA